MPRPVPSIPPFPEPRDPWVQDARAAAAALHTVPAFVPAPMPHVAPSPRPPVPDASPRGLRRAARCAAWALALFAGWLILTGVSLP